MPVEEEEVPQRTPISGLVGLSPLDTTPIVWEYPSEGICMLDLFGGISTDLATMLQAGIPVRKYIIDAAIPLVVAEVGYSRISVGFAITHYIVGGTGPCESWSY